MRRLRSEVGALAVADVLQQELDPTPRFERNMNAEQLAVIRHEQGPLANFAGAGSGKTRAVVHRVVRLVECCGVPAERVLCVTFSNAGASEMNERIRALGCPGVEVRTWHALCLRILREEGTREGSWQPDDKNRAKTLLKTALGYKHMNWVGADLSKLSSFIGICKANLWEPGSEGALAYAAKKFGRQAARANQAFAVSQELIEQAGILTFDDMLVYVCRLFAENDGVRASWAARFDHVIQDEAQDANLAQKALGEALSREHRNYMVVGDPGQSIFAFRGSSPEYLTSFEKDWQGARVVTMAKNYRSASAIVRVANDVIREGAHRLPEDMSAERGVEGEVRLVAAHTLEDEGAELVAFLKARFEGGLKPSDVCVLYRLNAQSRAIEEALLAARIPYVIRGGTNFYERAECKSLLGYLRVALGRDRDGEGLKRSINAPFRFLGSAFVEKVGEESSRGGDAVEWVERAARRDRIQSRQRASVAEWTDLVFQVGRQVRGECLRPTQVDGGLEAERKPSPWTASEVLSQLVSRTRYIEWLEKEEGEESIENSHGANVRELVRVSASFGDVGSFLDYVDQQVADAGRNKRKQAGNSVTMMTIHRSKGLEWPVVWVAGCNENVLPHAKGDPEEERRLAYVAFTRARDVLVASHVRQMALRNGVREVERSRFLAAFPGSAEPKFEVEAAVDCDTPGEVEKAIRELVAEDRNSSSEPKQVEAFVDDGVLTRALAWLGEDARCHDCEQPLARCACGEATGTSN